MSAFMWEEVVEGGEWQIHRGRNRMVGGGCQGLAGGERRVAVRWVESQTFARGKGSWRLAARQCRCMPTQGWHLPPVSTRIKSQAAGTADLQHPLKGVQGGDQE